MNGTVKFKKMYHLLGEQTIPACLTAVQFSPDITHYILTTTSDKTKIAARNLQNAFQRRGYKSELYFIGDEASAVSSLRLKPEIEKIFDQTNPDGEPACAEVTGGTKLMFYAMSVAAMTRKMPLIYVDTINRSMMYLNDGSVAELTEKLELEDFIVLSGYKFCKNEPEPQENPEETALANFFYKHYELLQMKQEDAAQCLTRKGLSTEMRKAQADGILKQLKQRYFRGEQHKFDDLWEKYSQGKSWEAQMRFIGGEWFECLIFSKLKQAGLKITEIRKSTHVSYSNDSQSVQEFDVVYTDGYTLVILECKAGKVKQEHIQKLENLRSAFSGAMGKCALVTLVSSKTKNNRAQNFSLRITNSRAIAAFCGRGGINQLPKLGFQFHTGKIYES